MKKYLEETRRQLISLLALVRWKQEHLEVSNHCEQLIKRLQQHQNHMHETSARLSLSAVQMVHNYRAPMYDVRTAVDVLATGTYRMLPDMDLRAIVPPKISDAEKAALMEQLGFLLRTELLRLQVPPDLTRIEVKDGRLILASKGDFELTLSLRLDHPARPFRVESVRLFVRAEGAALPQTEWLGHLGQLLEGRMATSAQPLVEAATILSDAVRIRTWQLLHAQALSTLAVPRAEVQTLSNGNSFAVSYWPDAPLLSFEPLMGPAAQRRAEGAARLTGAMSAAAAETAPRAKGRGASGFVTSRGGRAGASWQ